MKIHRHVSLATLFSFASGASVNVLRREEPLSVLLTSEGNSVLKVVLTNNGDKTLNLLNTGTVLDEKLPVERVTLYSHGGNLKVPFEGITVQLFTSALSSDDFLPLAAGEKKELKIDTATLHDLSAGGKFDVFVSGAIPYANENSTELLGALNYNSNKVSLSVDGTEAAAARKPLIKRTRIGPGCTGDRLTIINTALSNCQKMATAAAAAALAGTKLDIFFKSTSTSTRNEVSARLKAVAQDCGTTLPATITYCVDPSNVCATNPIIAYTITARNHIVYCPTFFTDVVPVSNRCREGDQGHVVVHETTHAPQVYSPPTTDVAYGYDAATGLSTEQALKNADSYALYANYIRLNC